MRGYLSVAGTSSGKVPVEPRVELFRDPEQTQEIQAVIDGEARGLDVRDVTVSRKKDGTPPVVLVARDQCIEIRNQANANGVTVRTKRGETHLDEGHVEQVDRDASLEIGYQTELHLTVQQERRVEVRGGDYVVGDKVDSSTHMEDSVVNRSDVGAGSAPDDATDRELDVEDSVVNRSNVGAPPEVTPDADDTREFCDTHRRTYTGGSCPECVDDSDDGGTKFCIHCGTELPVQAEVCSSCGESLQPD